MVDEQTFVVEVRTMERTLYRISRSYLQSGEECADAVQEALTKAWAKRGTVQPDHFRAWLTRIVINECHNIYRRKNRVVPAADVEQKTGATSERDIDLHEQISAMPEKLRMPLLLHYLEGFPLGDVALMLRVPVGTIKSRLHQARKKLKLQLEQEVNDSQ